MSHTLTLKISQQVFSAIQQKAPQIGINPEELATKLVEQQLSSFSPARIQAPTDQRLQETIAVSSA